MPLERFLRNFIVTRNGWDLFSKWSHYNKNGSPKVRFNTKKTAKAAAITMRVKRGMYFSNYKCIYCDGYHIGRNSRARL